jgi:MFS family permease
VLSRIRDRNIWLIDGSIFLLGLAYGISISLLAVFLDERGFTKGDIGSLAAWFAAGIVALSLPMGALIRRFSARTTLIASLVGYAMTVTAFPYLTKTPDSFALAAAIRFLDGAFSVGVWVSCETILLSRSDADNKASVTSLYATAMALGYVVGPLCAVAIRAALPIHFAFVISGVIAATASVLVLLRLDPDVPHHPLEPAGEDGGAASRKPAALGGGAEPQGSARTPAGGAGALLWRIKSSCFATFAYGYFQASVVLFLPLYLIEAKGISKQQTVLVPAFFAVGMLLFSNVAGRLGDRYGHLKVMRILGALGTLMIIGFVFLDHYTLMCVAVFIAGATLASISPVSLALQGVITEPRDYSRSNAIYNAFYATGMLLGPPISGQISGRAGGTTMLWHLAGLWTVFVVFTIVFARDDPASRVRQLRAAAGG